MFKNRVGNYTRRLVSETKPQKVIICMIYYLDEKSTGSWADCALKCLCYDTCPSRLQSGVRCCDSPASQPLCLALGLPCSCCPSSPS
jgi:hypothetical protein